MNLCFGGSPFYVSPLQNHFSSSSLFCPYLAAEALTRCSVWFIGMGLFVSRVEAHILGSVTHSGAVPSMLASDEFPYYRDDSPHGSFSSPLKREWALHCPCRVDTVILSALNLAWLCWDRGGSFLHFSWTHCEKMECLEFSTDCEDFINSGDFGPQKMPPSKLSPLRHTESHTHKKIDKSVPV